MCRFYLFGILAILFSVIAFIPDTQDLFGFDVQLNNFHIKLPSSFRGPLLANRWLSNAEHLYVNEIGGPESFAVWKGEVYTGIEDGRIIRLSDNDFETIAILDPENQGLENCRKPWTTNKHCGRPLGLRFDSKGVLYAIDPYNGIFSVDVSNGNKQLVMSIHKNKYPDGSIARFLDDFVMIEKHNGHKVFYMSDASTRWYLHDVFYTVGEHDQTGRLLSFDTETGQIRIELDHLAFPNGLELTDDKSAILFTELNKRRIKKFHLTGQHKGEVEVLVEELPGEPDNIKRSRDTNRETYWVALFTGRNEHNPSIALDCFSNNAFARRFFFRLLHLTGKLVKVIGDFLQHEPTQKLGSEIRVGKVLHKFVAEYGLAVEIDARGNIVNSLHSPDGYTSALSEVHEIKRTDTERHFYLGSFSNPYLGRLTVNVDNRKPKEEIINIKRDTLSNKDNVSVKQNNSPSTAKAKTDRPSIKPTVSPTTINANKKSVHSEL